MGEHEICCYLPHFKYYHFFRLFLSQQNILYLPRLRYVTLV